MATNSLASQAGRSKLSTDEFKLSTDDEEEEHGNSSKYTTSTSNNKNQKSMNNNNNTTTTTKPSSSYNTSGSSHNKPINNTNSSYTTANPTTNSSYSSSSSYNNRPSYNVNNNPNSSYNNNSFDRWNSSILSGVSSSSNNNNGDSIDLLQDQVSHLKREYEGLKQRFAELTRLRISEPEEILQDYKKLSQSRDEAAAKTIKNLHLENEELKKALKEAINVNDKKEATTTSTSSDDDNDTNDSSSDLLEIEKILKIYSSFSGLKITPKLENPLSQWHCEFSGRSGQFDFELNHQSDLGKYQYLPNTRVNLNLPPFLASDMLISPDQMQIFFWRLLDTLSKQQQHQS